jgi:hypothetical protein
MTIQPVSDPEPQQYLFTPAARLGWSFRDRRSLYPPYPEQPPDPGQIQQQCAARVAVAQRSWERARKWGLRPSLMVAVAIVALAGCAHALNPGAPFGTSVITAVIIALPGVGWSIWRWAQFNLAEDADPEPMYEAAREGWSQRAAEWDQVQSAQYAGVPEWGSAEPPARRTDVFGGTLEGWRCLLTVHGASIMSGRPLLVADLTGQDAASDLAGLAHHHDEVSFAGYTFPQDLGRSGLLTGLSSQELAEALAEAIHAGAGTRPDRAVDVRVLQQLASAVSNGRAGSAPPVLPPLPKQPSAAPLNLGCSPPRKPGSSRATCSVTPTVRRSPPTWSGWMPSYPT